MAASAENGQYERFYLDPEYWDGHMIGDGQAVEVPDDSQGFIHNSASTFVMNQALGKIAADSEPLNIFSHGQHFPIQAVSAGSLVLLNSESLRQPGFLSEEKSGLPSKPLTLSPLPRTIKEDSQRPGRRLETFNGLGYRWMNNWGIVRSADGKNKLYIASVNTVVTKKNGTLGNAFVSPWPVPNEALEEVGHVSHRETGRRSTIEELYRINTIEVHEPPKKAKQKKRALVPHIGNLLSRYSTGTVAT